jgi:signal transduction histidine kinase
VTRDLESRLKTLPPDSCVYVVFVTKDGAGKNVEWVTYLRWVAASANAPTYSWTDAAIDSGIVGGSRRDQLAETNAIGALARRVLRGERADDIPVSSLSTDLDQVDWRQLRRWGISEARVPAGTSVLFWEPGAWDQYRGYIVGVLALMLVQMALIAGLLVQRSKRRKAELKLLSSQAKLRASYDRIRQLGRRLIYAQEAERAHVAREVHDDINQQVAVLSMNLDFLRSQQQNAATAEELTRTLETARGVSKSLHNLSRRLHPAQLELLGLVAAVGALHRDYSRPGLSIAFAHRDVPSDIEHESALCLFRVAQEALANAVKHSHADHIWIQLTGAPSGLELVITDDGIGFDVANASSDGLGLTTMSERVESVGGVFTIQSTPGSGTRLRITVPARKVEIHAETKPVRSER